MDMPSMNSISMDFPSMKLISLDCPANIIDVIYMRSRTNQNAVFFHNKILLDITLSSFKKEATDRIGVLASNRKPSLDIVARRQLWRANIYS